MILGYNFLAKTPTVPLDNQYSSVFDQYYGENIDIKRSVFTTCPSGGSLDDRHQLRWVSNKLTTGLYEVAYLFGGGYLFAITYIFIHSLAISISYVNILRILREINPKKTIEKTHKALSMIIYLAAIAIFLSGPIGEFSYSVIELAFISFALFFSIKKSLIPFILIFTAALLHRESAILLPLVWLLFNKKSLYSLKHLVALAFPLFVYLIANFNIAECLISKNFLISFEKQEGQITWHTFLEGSQGILKGAVLILLNFSIIAPASYCAYYFIDKSSLNIQQLNFYKNLIFLSSIYFLIFLVATPLNHMSSKIIVLPYLIPIFVQYLVQSSREVDK